MIKFNNDYEDVIFLKTINVINRFMDQENGAIAVSFSGGQDSTILLDLVRRFIDKNIKGVFLNTGIEYPDIVRFVKTFDNIDIIKPKYSFFKIIKKYGLPIISKEQSRYIEDIQNPNICQKLKDKRLANGNFSISKKWRYILNEDIKVSNKCCYHLKKSPLLKYANKNKIKFMTGERCSESSLRKQAYFTCILPNKCVPFRLWTDNMIKTYKDYYKVKIADCYKTETRTGCMYCMYGYHMEDVNNNRFTRLKKYYPNFYKTGCKSSVLQLDKILRIIDKSRKKEK